MTIQELFVRCNEELLKVIDQIGDDQWELMMPEGVTSNPANLKQAVNYHTYDDAWVPDVLAGKTKEEVGDTYEPIRESENVLDEYKKYNQRAIDAVRDFTELDSATHLSYGAFSAGDYLQHITSFRALRIHDIAKLIGADITMAPDLVQGLQAEFSPVIEDYRKMGVFPLAIEVPADADPQTKLLAMFGRV